MEYQLRIPGADAALLQQALALRQQMQADTMKVQQQGKMAHAQTVFSSAFYNAKAIALYEYALGYPLDQVRALLVGAEASMRRVFELRGTEPPFPATMVTLDEKGRVLDRRPQHPPDSVDYSLTNSASGLEGMYLALIVANDEEPVALARMVQDPPDADYIGEDSEVCTPDQQHLAYAVRDCLLGDSATCLRELGLISHRTAPIDIQRQRDMVRAIEGGQSQVFASQLADLLSWHRKMAQRKANRTDPDYFASLPALALIALARSRGMAQQITLASPYLPLALLARGRQQQQ